MVLQKGDRMSKVIKDGDFTLIKVPSKDLASLVRFVAHAIEKDQDKVLDLSYKIVRDDLTKQDHYVEELSAVLDVEDWWIVLDGAESLQLCDELAETIYDEPAEGFGPALKKQKERHLRIVKICVDCQKAFVKGESHDCVVK
jgi:hypothetical protein